MPADIVTSPDPADIMRAVSQYYFPDGNVVFTGIQVRETKKDGRSGKVTTRVLKKDTFTIQFMGTQDVQSPAKFDMDAIMYDDGESFDSEFEEGEEDENEE